MGLSVKIEQITLENFQSLKDRVEIPIRPLTFLYGPNSAGKSSIFDALTFVNAVFNGDADSVLKYFKRWLHSGNSLSTFDSPESKTMLIEIDFKAWEFLLGDEYIRGDASSVPDEYFMTIGGLRSLLSASDGPFKLKIEMTLYEHQGSFHILSLMESLAITVYAKGLKIFKLHSPEGTDEPEIEFYPDAFGTMFEELSERHNVKFPSSRTYKTNCWAYNLGRGLELRDFEGNDRYDRDLVRIGNHILRCFIESNFLPENVASDRQTIPNSELPIFLNGWLNHPGLPENFVNAPIEAVASLGRTSSSPVYAIARSKFGEIFEEVTGQKIHFNNDEKLHLFVNRCLSHHLFLDQGYQISFDVCNLQPPLGAEAKKETFVALLVAYLIDSVGRRVTFEDVGTGISCVLPVIVAMHGNQSFIQQPELHLHPALQSALGDILVESVNRGDEGRHLIETHSDYLLLRCLRRIRETSNNKFSHNSSLKLKPTDVSILYFDPQPDGSTRIKPIRVSSQGDFLDRWPRGFFEERGKDLFDE